MNTSIKSLIGTFASGFVLISAMFNPIFTFIMAVILIAMLFVLQFAIGSKSA